MHEDTPHESILVRDDPARVVICCGCGVQLPSAQMLVHLEDQPAEHFVGESRQHG